MTLEDAKNLDNWILDRAAYGPRLRIIAGVFDMRVNLTNISWEVIEGDRQHCRAEGVSLTQEEAKRTAVRAAYVLAELRSLERRPK